VAEAERYNEQIDEVEENKKFVDPPTGDQARRGTADITITTGQGEIPVQLDREGAPCNVASFVHLTEQGFFDDSECHRLTVASPGAPLSVLQCGDPTGTGLSGPGYTIADEPPTDLPTAEGGTGASVYPRGTVAMAKSQAPDSAGSQFFLVYEDSQLPPEYSVMGTIDEAGLEVLDEIADAGVKSDDPSDPDNQVPAEEVVIETAELVGQQGLPEAWPRAPRRPTSPAASTASVRGLAVDVEHALHPAHRAQDVSQVFGVGHLEREPRDRHPVVPRGLHRRGQDVDLLVGEHLGHIRQQAVPVQRLDTDRHEEHRPGLRRPLHLDQSFRLAVESRRVGAVRTVHAHRAAAGDEPQDLVPRDRGAAAREFGVDVPDTAHQHAGPGRRRPGREGLVPRSVRELLGDLVDPAV